MFNDATTKLEIRATTESIWVSRVLPALVVALFFATIAAYYYGKYNADVDWVHSSEALIELSEKYHAITIENEALKESLAFEKAKSSSDFQIKRKAYDEIASTLAATSKEIASLRENIRFYESIIEGDERNPGLQIKSVLLHSGRSVGDYLFSVIIVNGDFGKVKSKGRLSIEVEGLKDGRLQTLNVTGKLNKNNALLFKYFQRVDGKLLIPDDFLPQRLHITAKLSGKKSEKKEKWYNWNILLNKSLPKGEGLTGT